MSRRVAKKFENAQSLCAGIAADIEAVIRADIETRDECHLVLTGGTVGVALLRDIDVSTASVDWSRVHVWWGDERFVDMGSAERNEGQATDALLARIVIPAENVHRMPAKIAGYSVGAAARDYADELAGFFGADFPHFDLVLLGVGPDAHVASLFPGLPGVSVVGQTVIPVTDSPKPPPERISLSLPSINAARRVWVVAAGHDKAEAVRLGITTDNAQRAPVSAVRGLEETCFYVDAAAAAELD